MWVKLDDGFVEHPKIAKVGAIGAWLQIQALCYCNRNLTDGFVPAGIARSFTARGVTRDETREDGRSVRYTLGEHSGMQGLDLSDRDWPEFLVAAGMWEPVEGGYLIHDYHEYQPTKEEVLRERKLHVARQQKYMQKKRDGVNDASIDGAPVPVPVPLREKNLALARQEKRTYATYAPDVQKTRQKLAELAATALPRRI